MTQFTQTGHFLQAYSPRCSIRIAAVRTATRCSRIDKDRGLDEAAMGLQAAFGPKQTYAIAKTINSRLH